MNTETENNYERPEAKLWSLYSLRLLEQMSITGELEEYEDGDDF